MLVKYCKIASISNRYRDDNWRKSNIFAIGQKRIMCNQRLHGVLWLPWRAANAFVQPSGRTFIIDFSINTPNVAVSANFINAIIGIYLLHDASRTVINYWNHAWYEVNWLIRLARSVEASSSIRIQWIYIKPGHRYYD